MDARISKCRRAMNKDDILQYVRERYEYDAATGTIRHKGKDRPVKGGRHSRGYLVILVGPMSKRCHIFLHRMAWALAYGRWPSQIDHINGDKTDNRLCNLREVTFSENLQNRLLPWKPNTRSGLPGVCILAEDKRTRYKLRGRGFRNFTFSDKYEAFHVLVMLGRMFREM